LYQDFSLNITMTTSASPCFASYGKLLGVSGIDVPVSDLLLIHSNLDDIKAELKSRSATCPSFQVDENNLVLLRGGKCNYCTACGGYVLNANTAGLIFGITGGSMVAVIVIPILTFICIAGYCILICWPMGCCGLRQITPINSRSQSFRPPTKKDSIIPKKNENVSMGNEYEMKIMNEENLRPNLPSYNPQFIDETNQPSYTQYIQGNFDPIAPPMVYSQNFQ
jgi:hypothetical protein